MFCMPREKIHGGRKYGMSEEELTQMNLEIAHLEEALDRLNKSMQELKQWYKENHE